jgi:bifunctional DNA-binding transcriptional regulator/antitoxin component of YhaV-PrlF toxin-antitoxin module
MTYGIADKVPKFFGAVTVGERGQVAIPAEACRELKISPADKLLAFGSLDTNTLILVKVEFMAEFLKTFTSLLTHFEQTLKTTTEASQADAVKPKPKKK